tara:strand:+ start:654 stop:1433 length:780 start_codon:yes stop_codon:yes gene_type:complete
MPACYKNFPINVGGVDIYATSAQLSEAIDIQTAESYGIIGSQAAYNTQLPNGTLSIDGYIKTSVTPLLDLIRSNNQNLAVTFGKYTLPNPAIISSINITMAVGSAPSLSISIDYFGTATVGGAPAPVAPTDAPLNIEGVSLGGFGSIGISQSIQSVTYDLNQNYETHTLLGEIKSAPIVVFHDGSASLSVDCQEMMAYGLTQVDKPCLVAPAAYSVSFVGCGGVDYGTINISAGYLQERGTSIDTSNTASASVSIIEYL